MSENTNPLETEVEDGIPAVADIEDVADDIIDDVIIDEDDPSGPAEYAASEGGRTGRGGGNLRPNEIDYKNVTQLSRFLDAFFRDAKHASVQKYSARLHKLSSAPVISP